MFAWWGVLAVVVTGAFGLVAKWMVLRFLERMHQRGGREDMLAAAEALRHVRSWHATRELAARRLRRLGGPKS